MNEKKYLIGCDIGGTKCAVVLAGTDKNGDGETVIIAKKRFPTDQPRGWRKITDEFFAAVDEILSENNIDISEISAIGISCGGPLDSGTGVIKCPPNLPDWDNVPITELFASRYGIPAFLENDANACALAEWKYGAGRGYDNVVFLTFGTGMGAGLILDGRLYSGTNGMAGEVGHIRLEKDGPFGYGKNGSFEGFCSGGGIAGLARTMCASYEKKYGVEGSNLTAKYIAEKANEGDEEALEVYRCCGRHLGMGLAILTDILNPQAIVIGSIYQRAENLLRDEMLRTLREEALPEALSVCRILPAALGDAIGDYAAIGVASLMKG